MMNEPTTVPCTCPYCRLRGLTLPVLLIVLGVPFLLHMILPAMTGVVTLAILLIVIGALQLVQRLAPTTGHRNPYA